MLPATPVRCSGPSPPLNRISCCDTTDTTVRWTTPPFAKRSQRHPPGRGSSDRLALLFENVWAGFHHRLTRSAAVLYTRDGCAAICATLRTANPLDALSITSAAAGAAKHIQTTSSVSVFLAPLSTFNFALSVSRIPFRHLNVDVQRIVDIRNVEADRRHFAVRGFQLDALRFELLEELGKVADLEADVIDR